MPPPLLSSSFGLLKPRQNDFQPVPVSYGAASSSPHPGVVAGIVIGSVGGFLLVLFLVYSCLGFGPSIWVQPSRSEYTAASQSVLSFRTRRTSRTRSARRHHSRGPRVTETYEVRTRESRGGRTRSRAPPVVVDEPVIVEPTRAPPPPRVVRSEDSEEEEEDDEIVVLEEHSPPRRKSRRRSSDRRRSEERYSRGGGSSYYHDAEPGSPYRERRDRHYSRDR